MDTYLYIWGHTHKNLYATWSCTVIKRIGQATEVLPKHLTGMNILSLRFP